MKDFKQRDLQSSLWWRRGCRQREWQPTSSLEAAGRSSGGDSHSLDRDGGSGGGQQWEGWRYIWK